MSTSISKVVVTFYFDFHAWLSSPTADLGALQDIVRTLQDRQLLQAAVISG
jgi:hypothetical protein